MAKIIKRDWEKLIDDKKLCSSESRVVDIYRYANDELKKVFMEESDRIEKFYKTFRVKINELKANSICKHSQKEKFEIDSLRFKCYLCDKHMLQPALAHDDFMDYNDNPKRETLIGYKLTDDKIICNNCVNERNKDGVPFSEGYFLTEPSFKLGDN